MKTFSPILDRNNTVLLLVDEQIGLLSGVRDISTADLRKNAAALVKVAQILKIPIVITAVGSDGLWGPVLPEILEAAPNVRVIKRTSINAWDSPEVVKAVEATGRKQILVAGISLEVCASLPAISATQAGYDARVVLDASGTFYPSKREAGIQRLTTLGIQMTDYATAAVELLNDNADPKAHDIYNAIGLDFANTVWQLNDAVKKGYK
ncbi:MAG: isochorismatase family protein [Flavobacterium sp.]|uniref:isochorismatase family protein n=1 Tax=Flavobacterium sp. TaxID=239 RepID=UPI001B25D21F|nr:isochorismatase family protein [Flavobacterium sp.]MBO9585379.1 isochorismatase family protein [Flavobacterium sp.]